MCLHAKLTISGIKGKTLTHNTSTYFIRIEDREDGLAGSWNAQMVLGSQ